MFKTLSVILLNIIFIIPLWAQQVSILSKQYIHLNKEVFDLAIVNDRCYLLSKDSSFYEMTSDGQVTFINQDRKSFYEKKLINIIPQKIDISRYQYLCNDGSNFYGCISEGWSSRIVKINPLTGEETFLTYICGIPAGLITRNSEVWYLFNKNSINENGIIKRYDIHTGMHLMDIEIPVIIAKGLAMTKDGTLLSFENRSSTIFSLKIEEGK